MARKSLPVVTLTVKLVSGETIPLHFDDLAVANATKDQLNYDFRVAKVDQTFGSMCKTVNDALAVFDRVAYEAMLKHKA